MAKINWSANIFHSLSITEAGKLAPGLTKTLHWVLTY